MAGVGGVPGWPPAAWCVTTSKLVAWGTGMASGGVVLPACTGGVLAVARDPVLARL